LSQLLFTVPRTGRSINSFFSRRSQSR